MVKDALPSDLHSGRSRDENGNFIGFNADRRFSKHCIAILDFVENELKFKLMPIDLGPDRKRLFDRGIPVIASEIVGEEIVQDLNKYSE